MSNKEVGESQDPLSLSVAYPEAHKIFSVHVQALDSVFATAVFVLDTNALLVPYGVTRATLDEIGNRYRALIKENRLLIPAHVAREFANQRGEKLKELFQQLTRARQTKVRREYPALLAGLPEFSDVTKLEEEIEERLGRRSERLEQLLNTIRGWRWDDPVSTLYRELFTENAIQESDLSVDEAKKDVAARRSGRIPPGFKDATKDVNAAGDVLVWHSVLTLGRKRGAHAVLISGEEKTDWFYRSEGVPLYPDSNWSKNTRELRRVDPFT
jgi:hypothetical protein